MEQAMTISAKPNSATPIAKPTIGQIWVWLDDVPDPEIPVISITDLGIVREVFWQEDTLVVKVTLTYSGCPATSIINFDIERVLRQHGIENLHIERQLSPAWTSDWLKAEARERLRDYGIAPPIDGTQATGDVVNGEILARINRLMGANLVVLCPRCGTNHTQKISQAGSTPCKATYRCKDYLEPFDYFKCI